MRLAAVSSTWMRSIRSLFSTAPLLLAMVVAQLSWIAIVGAPPLNVSCQSYAACALIRSTVPNANSWRGLAGLEKLYIIGPQARASGYTSNVNSPPTMPRSPESIPSSSSPSSMDSSTILALKDPYLAAITSKHVRHSSTSSCSHNGDSHKMTLLSWSVLAPISNNWL